MRLLLVVLCALLAAGPLAPLSASQAAPQPARVTVLLQLGGEPLVRTWLRARSLAPASAANAVQTQARSIDAAQARLQPFVAAAGGQTLYTLQRSLNAVAVSVPASSLAMLAHAPGVRAVRPVPRFSVGNSSSVPQIGAPQLWGGLGLHGEGITIGVIDTGINYLHRDFGGPGWRDSDERNDTTLAGDILGYPSAKVAGGYDFSGDNYNADPDSASYQPIPAPDPDPMDCYGHGTHVAGTAAGYGVTNDGQTYAGPWNAATTPPFAVGPGVAPQATLYALRVFGCGGSSDLVPQALEWAMDPNGDNDFADHLDIVNLSLGSPFGGATDDPMLEIVDSAAQAGVIVVAAAGNSGDTFYNVSSPGSADWAISVAASAGSGGGETLAGFSARGPRWGDSALKPDVAAPGSGIASASSSSGVFGSTLSGTSMATPHIAGALALLRQLHPTWSVEELKALLLNTAVVQPSTESAPYSASRLGVGRVSLPPAAAARSVAYNADDPGLISISFGAPQVTQTVTLTKSLRVANKGHAPASYTLAAIDVVTAAGVTVSVEPAALTLQPGESALAEVQMRIDPAGLDRTLDGATSQSSDEPKPFLNEHSGFITVTGPETLQVPFYAAPRPASATGVSEAPAFAPGEQTATLELASGGAANPAFPPRSWVLELQELGDDIASACGPTAELAAVGVGASTPAAGDEQLIFFGIATRAPRSSPHPDAVQVRVEIRTPAGDEFLLTNGLNSGTGDAYRSVLLQAPARPFDAPLASWPLNGLDGSTDTGLFNAETLVLPVSASALGLEPGATRFSYQVRLLRNDGHELCDAGVGHSFDPAAPAYGTAGGLYGWPLWDSAAGTSIEVQRNPASITADAPLGLLALHPINEAGAQVAIVPTADVLFRSYAPLIGGR